MDGERLADELAAAFDAPRGERTVVVRQAVDLDDSGQFRRNTGQRLTVPIILENLRDAPDDLSLSAKWNWWVGALGLAYGGYDQFTIGRWKRESRSE